mgnify:FL=1
MGLAVQNQRERAELVKAIKVASTLTLLLQQFAQLQVSLQYTPAAKHSQYSFVHREFLQLQLRFFFMWTRSPELIGSA